MKPYILGAICVWFITGIAENVEYVLTPAVIMFFIGSYLLHFSQPKQSKTRGARIEKYTPQILKGKGLND